LAGVLKEEDLPADVKELAEERGKARREKNFKESDRLRDEIEKQGYMVEDTKDGQRVSKK
jgi:cysteinyl-tRNA synthetase